MTSIMSGIVAGMLLFSAPVIAQTAASGDASMEILKQKLKADKKLLVAENMGLSDEEGKRFWPLYDGYQKELESINQRLRKAITAYAEAYSEGKGSVSNDTAKKLLQDAISVEQQEVNLKRAYAERIGKVLSPAKAARYIQIENKIRAIIKMELAEQIPLVH